MGGASLRLAMLIRQLISTDFRQPREQSRSTAIACEMSDGLDQGTLDQYLRVAGSNAVLRAIKATSLWRAILKNSSNAR